MIVVDRICRLAGACFRTGPRAFSSVLLLLLVGVGVWQAVQYARGYFAYNRAVESLERYDFATARQQSRLAGYLEPGNPLVWLLAAQAARREGDLGEARSHLRLYRSLVGSIPEARLEAALQETQSGNLEAYVYDLMAKVDAGHPAAEQILEALAVGSVQIYHFDRGVFWINQLLSRYPVNPVGRLIRAQMDDVLRKRDRATAGCRELLADFPDNRNAKVLLAGLLYREQQFDESAQLYRELHQKYPDDLRPLLGLTRCHEQMGQAEEARSLVQELEEKFSDNSSALLEAARFALADNRQEDAERLLRRAVELSPGDYEIHYQMGLCLERAGKTEEARYHLERFKQVEADVARLDILLKEVVNSSKDPIPRREAGMICLRNGQTSEGLRWLLGALELAPTDKLTHAALADYYTSQGDLNLSAIHRQRAR